LPKGERGYCRKKCAIPIRDDRRKDGRDQKKSDDDKWRRILSQTHRNQIRAKPKQPEKRKPAKCTTVNEPIGRSLNRKVSQGIKSCCQRAFADAFEITTG